MSYFRDLLPSAQDYVGAKDFWRHDVVAGVTVGIVALPLALAFGITTGAGARAGLITAIYAGVVAAIFGGSNYQVSGPTGVWTSLLSAHRFSGWSNSCNHGLNTLRGTH
jgi:SulP family sulfate permease